MIGTSRCKRAVMNTGVVELPFGRDHDPVELGYRAPRRKAFSRSQHPPGRVAFTQRAAVERPIVGITHQHRRTRMTASTDMRQDGAQLLAAAQARQVEMHPDHPQPATFCEQIDPDSSAGFKRGQWHYAGFNDAEFAQRPAVERPFVGITHQHSRTSVVAPADMRQDSAQLLAATQARQVQMHPDYPQPATSCEQIDPDSSAGFKRRQRHYAGFNDAEFAPHQQRVAMPADTVGPHGQRHCAVGRVLVNRCQRKHAFAPSKAPVHLLQRDHIGVDLAQDRENPVGITASIEPDRLVDIVAGESQLHSVGQASPAI